MCRGYDPPEGFLPDLTKPLLDHSYGESLSHEPCPWGDSAPLWSLCLRRALSPTCWWRLLLMGILPKRILSPTLPWKVLPLGIIFPGRIFSLVPSGTSWAG